MVDNGRIMKELKELQEAAKNVIITIIIAPFDIITINIVTKPNSAGINRR